MKKMVKWGIVVILLAAVIFFVFLNKGNRSKKTPSATPPLKVVASYVCLQKMPISVSATGQILAQKQTVLQVKQAGYITQISFKEGESVKAGQILIVLDHRTASADLQKKIVALQQAKLTYDRNLQASDAGGISKEALEADYVAYQNAQNDVEQAQITLSDLVIRAPFAGVVGSSQLSVGEYITPQTKLVSLLEGSNLRINYTLPSQYLNQARVGQVAEVMIAAHQYQAKVSFVGSEIDPSTQTFSLTAQLTASATRQPIYPGAYVQITQQLGVKAGAIVLPGLSVQTEVGSYYVYEVRDGKAQQHVVTIGRRVGDSVEVTSGLKQGQLIITEGADQLRQGSAVTVSQTQHAECRL